MILKLIYEMTLDYKERINNTKDKTEIERLRNECSIKVKEIIGNFTKNETTKSNVSKIH